ncbi:hypothetical protein DPMN_038289 [Dreissena polymorpha]|uniref:Uncharacterized protein n=1 Tax=Dreissena polymorpha TaxID=45954 RepID=A0A9D4MCU3_DREPO|nr:hypothetical protein DPMN_038289 [Dreissena polymorpha]
MSNRKRAWPSNPWFGNTVLTRPTLLEVFSGRIVTKIWRPTWGTRRVLRETLLPTTDNGTRPRKTGVDAGIGCGTIAIKEESTQLELEKKLAVLDEEINPLEDRFTPANQTELYRVQLRDRRQRASETLAELGQDIRRFANLAYPSAPTEEKFINSLVNSDLRLKVNQARPTYLKDAARHAVELEAFFRTERRQQEQESLAFKPVVRDGSLQ